MQAWRRQVGSFVLVSFLPIFFTYTGLRTNVLELSTLADLVCVTVTLAASVLGKIIPVYGVGRLCGFGHWGAAVLGTLMNTRPLMELILLNVGLDLRFIPQRSSPCRRATHRHAASGFRPVSGAIKINGSPIT